MLMKVAHYNKREKLANLFFDLSKYLSTVIGIGGIVPGNTISLKTVFIGMLMAIAILGCALIITPEEKE